MIRVVGEELGRHQDRADSLVERSANLQPHRLPLAQELRLRPAVEREEAPVDRQPQALAHQRREPFAPRPQDVGIENQGRILDVELVGDVPDVGHYRDVQRPGPEPQVDEAERRRVRDRSRGRRGGEGRDDRQAPRQMLHRRQW